jgi:hypothetical protein
MYIHNGLYALARVLCDHLTSLEEAGQRRIVSRSGMLFLGRHLYSALLIF